MQNLGEARLVGEVADDATSRDATDPAGGKYRRYAAEFEDVIAVLDGQGGILDLGESVVPLLGHRPPDLVGKDFFGDSLVHPDDAGAAREFLDSLLNEPEAIVKGRFRLRHADGTYRRLELSGRNCLRDEEIQGFVVGCFDLAERIRAGLTDRLHGDLLRVVVEGTTDGIYVKDRDGRFLMANPGVSRMVGREIADILGRDDSELIEPEFARRVMEEDRQVRDGGVIRTVEEAGVIRGEERTFLSTKGPFHDQDGRVAGTFGISRDITEIRRSEEARARLAAIVESSDDAIISKDFRGVVTSWNAGAERIYGYRAEEMIGRPIEVLFPADRLGEEPEILGRVLRGERIEHFESVRVARDGREIDVSLSISPVLDDSGRIIGVSKIARDITDRNRIVRELHAAKSQAEEASRAKDRFLAMLSHELRTPLTPVLATLSYVEVMPDLPAILREEVVSLRRNVELEARLIDDLLDVTRIGQGKLILNREPVDAHDAIRAALEVCRPEIERKGLELSIALRARRSRVSADPARIQQIFWNLLQNAVKFTPEEGRISVRSWDTADGRFRAQVADTGIGIEPELLARIFEPFEQTARAGARRQGGLGLGLTIALRLAELHSGELTAASEGRDRGAAFTVGLDTIPTEAEAEAARQVPPERGLRILLVEDNPDTLRAISKLLRIHGFHVQGATTVGEACRAAAGDRFDLLVSDIGLPDGSGLDVMRHVRDRFGLRGIALSGYGADEDVSASRDAGFVHHMVKPVKIDRLVGLIQESIA